jgi:hypothetical protein
LKAHVSASCADTCGVIYSSFLLLPRFLSILFSAVSFFLLLKAVVITIDLFLLPFRFCSLDRDDASKG